MTREQMQALQPGDIVRHKHSSEGMVVTGNYGAYVVAVRTTHVANPEEWDVVQMSMEGQCAVAAQAIARASERWQQDLRKAGILPARHPQP